VDDKPHALHSFDLSAEHQYTEANLRFEHLKGADRAMARALSTCAAIDAHLVLVTRRVSGTTTSPWGGRKRNKRCRWYDDFEDEDEGPHTMGEVRPPCTHSFARRAVAHSIYIIYCLGIARQEPMPCVVQPRTTALFHLHPQWQRARCCPRPRRPLWTSHNQSEGLLHTQ